MSSDVSMEVLAKQCGTSVQMIEQHYSRVVPSMYAKELSGVDIGSGKSPEIREQRPKAKAKNEARLITLFKGWEGEIKVRERGPKKH